MKTNLNLSFCKTLPGFGLIAFLSVGLLLGSCSPVFYSAVGTNVPLLKEKGEVAFSGGYSQTDHGDNDYLYYVSGASGFNLQFAAAIDSNLAIMSSFYSLSSNFEEDDWTGKGSYFELGIGKFDAAKKSKSLIGEIFVGTGIGSMKNFYEAAEIRSTYVKPFIQPTGGISSKFIDFAVTPRIGCVIYTDHSIQGMNGEENRVAADFFSDKKVTFVFEPGFTLRVGIKNVKIQYQVNYTTFNYSDQVNDEDFDPVNPLYQSFGLSVLISNRWSKKKLD